MKKRILDFLLLAVSPLLVAAFWLLIWYGRLHEGVKVRYFKLFKIPYYKMPDKFGPYYVRRK